MKMPGLDQRTAEGLGRCARACYGWRVGTLEEGEAQIVPLRRATSRSGA